MEGLTFHPLPSRLRDAKALRRRYFYTGKPCKRLHFSMRYSPSGMCLVCKDMHAASLRATKARREETNRKKREYWQRLKHENPDSYERAKAKNREYGQRMHRERGPAWEKAMRRKRDYLRRNPDAKRRQKRQIAMAHKRRISEGDEQYIATLRWRQLLYRSLRLVGGEKEGTTNDNLGYSARDLMDHMESLFEPGMSWSNHGEWHIDHIRPISTFPTGTHPSIVNALDNLQPLWAKDNLSKHNQWE